MLKGKTILLGVSGGIAAYKAVALCSKLAQAGADVRVIMTESATRFVVPLTFQALSRNRVVADTFDEQDPSVVSHIDLADSADLVIVAPATANVIAKTAHGIADDMLSTTLLATTAPIVIAPAMNVHMYEHPAVQQNMRLLRERGIEFVDPGTGQLACGYVGQGRLAEPEVIFDYIVRSLRPNSVLQGRKLLVTAGATLERIDPVRYITNDSSGKMGYAIAEAAREMGADVTLITGSAWHKPPDGIHTVRVVSTQDMYEAVMERLNEADIVIKAAAVADYRPVSVSGQKIKKTDDILTLTMERTPDILKAVGERKTTQFVVGFAAETNDVGTYALEKLKRKQCDLIVANDVTETGAGFGTDTNVVKIFDANGLVRSLPMMLKKDVSRELLQIVAERLAASRRDG
jgi:phosphopantothenoylcysteine decarboxylase/phosphopantothenate--cysteine ligase